MKKIKKLEICDEFIFLEEVIGLGGEVDICIYEGLGGVLIEGYNRLGIDVDGLGFVFFLGIGLEF